MKMRKLVLAAIIAGVLAVHVAQPVQAQTLDIDKAKAAGSIGEMEDGLLGVVNPSSEMDNLVASVNKQRMEQYKQIAGQQGTSVQSVQMIAGQKLIQRLEPGHFYKKAGKWLKR